MSASKLVITADSTQITAFMECNIAKYSRIIVTIDSEDAGKILRHNWRMRGNGDGTSICTENIYGQTISLPRFILNYVGDLEVDHIDHNIYNNRKSNFRLATRAQQNANRGPSRGKLYKGTCRSKRTGYYFAELRKNGTTYRSATFTNEEDAAREYDKLAIKFFKEFAYLNFPEVVNV